MFKSNQNPMFRSQFAESIFHQKYQHEGAETWADLAKLLVKDVCNGFLTDEEMDDLIEFIVQLKFLPGGRYLYYAGRNKKFFNNCYLLKAEEDTREDWASLSQRSELCLSTGGGIGVDYSVYRASGSVLHGTGGVASGPLAKMQMVNEIGRGIIQGGSRRSAIYASLSHTHGDINAFMKMKNWHEVPVVGTDKTLADLRNADFNFPVPMDFTNISVNYDTEWLLNYWETGDIGEVFKTNCRQALSTGEPGFSFNFFRNENETLRNACTEVTSRDDSDVCNLGSINFGRVDSISELRRIVELGTKFLLCGTKVAALPYEKVYDVRGRNRRLGLGVMGLHEWLIKRGKRYGPSRELKRWLSVYENESDNAADQFANTLSVSRPVAVRAVAPTGSIGILAGTSTGIEPIFAVSYKRRYLKGRKWLHQYVVDATAQEMIDLYDTKPEDIETALGLSGDYEKRIEFQADVQDFVDQAISSTINLPKWGTDGNNPDMVVGFASCLAKHAHRLRGFTCYPDSSRGGQPLVSVSYDEAKAKLGEEFEEAVETHDICSIMDRGGTCGA